MNIKELQRDFNLSDSELALYASNLVGFMTRDAAEFAARGVNAAAITALEAKGNEFEAFPTDAEYQGLVTIATEDKDADREQLHVDIRGITDRAMLKWGEDSGRYKRFDVKNLTKLADKDLHFAARRVVRIGTIYLADLAAEGLTQAMLDALTALAQSFEDNLNDLRDAIAVRDEKTEERIELGNELYALVSKYCEIGKVIWKETSEAKYNDYIIYPTEHHGLSKPQNVDANYDPLEPLVVTLTWDLVSEATSYDVYYDIAETGAPAGDFEFLNNYSTSPIVIQAVFQKRNYFKLKAKNSEDTSAYSDEAWVDVPEEPV
jgi:hypothetical protein